MSQCFIGLSGTHCVGKTYVFNELKRIYQESSRGYENKIYFIPERIEAIVKMANIDINKVTPEERDYIQREALKQHARDLEIAKQSGRDYVISDRTYYDIAAYCGYYSTTIDIDLYIFAKEFLDFKYDRIYYFKPEDIAVTKDMKALRHGQGEGRKQVDNILIYLLNSFKQDYTKITSKLHKRVKQVTSYIET